MGRVKPNKPRRSRPRHHVAIEVDHVEDLAALALRLALTGCPHCGGRAELRPGPAVLIDHRGDCPELTDPGHLTCTDELEENADV